MELSFQCMRMYMEQNLNEFHVTIPYMVSVTRILKLGRSITRYYHRN